MAAIYGTTNSDTISGTTANDTLYGWARGGNASSPSGNDTLNGFAGSDKLNGGTGFDDLSGNAGNDTLYGNSGKDSLSGGGGNDKLYGQGGNDTLNGGSGTDTLIGGTGDDIYFIDSIKDRITELFNEQVVFDEFDNVIGAIDLDIDTVQSAVNYQLGSNLENLTLTGSAIKGTGNAINNILIGNSNNNFLNGGQGNDLLDGGLGTDVLSGGTGNDFYIYNPSDTIIEYFNQGIDSVESSVSYTLGDNLENLILTGLSDISGTGNSLNNIIVGNDGNNFLYGGEGNDDLIGQLGNDTLIGGIGNDIYDVDSTQDIVVEFFNQGVDLVESSISYTLGDNLENLQLLGSSDINGIGNALDNKISDNSGFNILDGGAGNDTIEATFGDTLFGGEGDDFLETGFGRGIAFGNAGNDTLFGGTDGDDTLYGGSGNDLLEGGILGNEKLYGGDGNDTIGAGTEGNDTLYGGNGNDFLIGSTEGDDTLYGGNGNDTLEGTTEGNNTISGGTGDDILVGGSEGNDTLAGGSGNDTLTGFGGRNTFKFYSPYQGVDTITDFVAQDTISVSASGFDMLTTGAVTSEEFKIGSAAGDQRNRFIYNNTTGALFFDADGTGASSQVQFAQLATDLAITNNNFLVFS